MANKLLLPIYERIFNKSFSYGNFEDRLQMQKMVYLLQEEGVNIGHYGFDWYKHGPYSQVLLDDMYMEDRTITNFVNYTSDVEKRIDCLKSIFGDENNYGMKNWTECLASIHFLRKKIMGSNATKEDVLQELKNRKPHLDNDDLNNKAYEYIEGMFE